MMPDISEILRKMAMGQDSPGDHPLNLDTPTAINLTGQKLGDGSTNNVKDGVPDNTQIDRPEAQKVAPSDIATSSIATTDKAPQAADDNRKAVSGMIDRASSYAPSRTNISPIMQQYQALLAAKDHEYQAAVKESERNDATRNLRTDVGQLGKNMVAITAGRAGIKGPDIDYGTQEDPDSPVKKYIQMKAAERAPAEAYLKDEDTASQIAQRYSTADKNSAFLDPNSPANVGKLGGLRAKMLALDQQEQAIQENARQHGWTRAHGDAMQRIQEERLPLYKEMADAANENAKTRGAHLTDTENQGMIAGAGSQQSYLPLTDRKDLERLGQGYLSAKQVLAKLQDITQRGISGRITDAEMTGELNAYYHEAPDTINRALSTITLGGPRAKGLHDALTDPNGAKGLALNLISGNERSRGELKAFQDFLDENLKNAAAVRGVSDYQPGTNRRPTVDSALPGRPGSASAPNGSAVGAGPAVGGQTKITVTNNATGKTKVFDSATGQAFITNHGKEKLPDGKNPLWTFGEGK